jgi:hypothetical protein
MPPPKDRWGVALGALVAVSPSGKGFRSARPRNGMNSRGFYAGGRIRERWLPVVGRRLGGEVFFRGKVA